MLVATVYIIWVSTITQRLCFLFCSSTEILLESCVLTAYLSCYAIIYSTVFGAVFDVYIVGVG